MKDYVQDALRVLKHMIPKQHYKAPSLMERPVYGAKIQYVKEDISPPLSTKQIKYIQQATGKLLYYARAIDNTMLHALNEISIGSTRGTTATMKAMTHLLNYASSNPNAEIMYRASEMVLRTDSDAAYLVSPGARSRAGGYHYLADRQGKFHN